MFCQPDCTSACQPVQEQDKTLFDKLAMNRDVVVEIVQQGSDCVITSVK